MSLSWTGIHQLPRGRVVDIFALSQLALIGNLLAKLVFEDHYSVVWGLGFSYFLYVLGNEFISKALKNKKNSTEWMIGVYVLLSSFQYLLIGLFPVLDSHMSIGFFGNLVTATFYENLTMFILFSLAILCAWRLHPAIARCTLSEAILGQSKENRLEFFLFSVILVTSLFGLGFFYTLGFLLLPALMFGKTMPNQKRLHFIVIFVSVLSSLLGLALSLVVENISTSSAQVSLLFVFGSLGLITSKVKTQT